MERTDLVTRLVELRAPHILILAALGGQVSDLKCAMPDCECAQGRGYFERKGDPKRNPWAPSPDRWPLPGYRGGTYVVENVRLAHWECNQNDWRRHAKERQPAIPEWRRKQWAETGKRNACFLWNIKRGKACVCGNHDAPWAEPVAVTRAFTAAARAKGTCTLWNMQRGKPCVCGQHKGAPAARPRTIHRPNGVALCVRWQIRRGKPCVCGHH